MDTKTYYFVGIGGIGMSAIARYLFSLGNKVYGYDRTPSALTKELEKEGMNIVYRDDAAHIADSKPDLVVYTPAVGKDNAILRYAFEHCNSVKKRSEVLGLITRDRKTAAVAGTHGKTTTSGLIAHILHASPCGCSAFLGGISNNYDTNCLIDPHSDLVVAEADEYDRSFLQLSPYYSVITSIAEDHLDIYGSLENIEEAFIRFADKTNPQGGLFLKYDLPVNIPSKAPVYTYSLLEEKADFHAQNIRVENGTYLFDFHTPQKVFKDVRMTYPGRHNIENAIAALAVVSVIGVEENLWREGLETFRGMKRRFDLRHKGKRTVYYDDYAHHPQEIEATLRSLRELYPQKRICAVFQPHLYSRTRDFADAFAKALELSDEAILLPLYPARENPIEGISSATIFDKIGIENKYLVEKSELIPLLDRLQPELLVTLGAGDIDRLTEPISEFLKENE